MEQELVILPDGLHLWNPAQSHLGSVPDEIIDSRSTGYTLHLMDNPEWRKLQNDSIVVMGDVPDQALKVLAVTAEKFDEMLRKEIGGPPQRYVFKVRIFQDRGQFCSYARRCGAYNALSLYDPRVGEMALHFGSQTDRESFEETYAHEFVHAYMDRIYNVTEPLWFAEGMAEYFSLLKWTSRGYKPTGKNWRAAMHVDVDNLIPLPQLVTASRETIYGLEFTQYYAQSWGVVHFLLKRHPEIVEGLLNKQKIDISPLADEYAAYMKKLLG